ncbi:hypothetical protein HDU76_001259 [Blyttiomyces sp. JEL0837]|nr:hypothetical protein HDU76_001259 [Blyttiomyces sp. JEL0837]
MNFQRQSSFPHLAVARESSFTTTPQNTPQNIQATLLSATTERDFLRNRLVGCQKDRAELHRQIKELKAGSETTDRNLRGTITGLQDTIRRRDQLLQEEAARHGEELEGVRVQVKQLEGEKAELEGDVEVLKKELKGVCETLAGKDSELELVLLERNKLEGDVGRLHESLEFYKGELESRDESLKALVVTKDKLAEDNEKLKEKLVLGEEVLEVKLKAHGDLMDQNKVLTERVEVLQSDFQSAKEALSEKDRMMDGLLEEEAQLKEAVGQLTDQLGSKAVEADSLREVVEKVDKELTIVRGEKEVLLRELQAAKEMAEDSNSVKFGLEQELKEATRGRESPEREVEELRALLEAEREARLAAEQQHLIEFAKWKKELEALKSKDTSTITTQTTSLETSIFTTQTDILAVTTTTTQTEIEIATRSIGAHTTDRTTTTTQTQTDTNKKPPSKFKTWFKNVCVKVSAAFSGLKRR